MRSTPRRFAFLPLFYLLNGAAKLFSEIPLESLGLFVIVRNGLSLQASLPYV